MVVAMAKTLPPEPYEPPPDDAATERTLVEIMRRQRERDRRLLRLATTVAIASLILAFTATFVAWSQHAGWRMRRSATRSPSVPASPPSVATRPAPGQSAPPTSAPPTSAPPTSAPQESAAPGSPPHVDLPPGPDFRSSAPVPSSPSPSTPSAPPTELPSTATSPSTTPPPSTATTPPPSAPAPSSTATAPPSSAPA